MSTRTWPRRLWLWLTRPGLPEAITRLIRLGWNPPNPTSEQAQRIVDDIIHVKPYADRAQPKRLLMVREGMNLSGAEVRCLELAANGLREKQIAQVLHYSPDTVKSYSKTARRKLGARNTAHAVAIAYRAGIIDLGREAA